MSSDRWAIEQTVRSFFASINLPHAEIIFHDFDEFETFDFVEFSYQHYAYRGIVILRGEYRDQPGYLFLDAQSSLLFSNARLYDEMEKHKKDYPHGIGL